MNWYLSALRQYANFSGRARRKEYWMFTLFNVIFLMLAGVLDMILGLTIGELPYGIFYFLYAIAVIIPGLAVGVRRLHDVGKSGHMIWLGFIPIIGSIWLFVLFVSDGEPEENEYGSNPKLNPDGTLVSEESSSDLILLIVVIWMLVSRLFWSLAPIENFYLNESFMTINVIMGVISAFIPLGLAFAVKEKSKQVILIVLGCIYLLYGLFQTIEQYVG